MKRALFYGFLLLFLGQTLRAQSPSGMGRSPLGSYFDAGLDSINLYSGNLMLNVGLISLPGRELPAGLQLFYNAQGWTQINDPVWGSYSTYLGGWRFANPAGELTSWEPYLTACDYWLDYDAWYGSFELWVTYKDGTGASHTYYRDDIGGWSCDFEQAFQEYANGANFWLLPYSDYSVTLRMYVDTSMAVHLVAEDGARIDPESAIVSRNGNYVTFSDPGGGPLPEDTLGRTIGYSTGTNTLIYTVTDSNDEEQEYTLHLGTKSAYNPIDSAWMNISIITAIDLPNGTSFEFAYDHDQGFLTKVTLPTGGTIEYEYVGGNDEVDLEKNYVVARRVSADGTNEVSWAYERDQNGSTRTVTVTNPELDVIEHEFANGLPLETTTRWRNTASSDPSQVVLTQWEEAGPSQIDTQRESLHQVTTLSYSNYYPGLGYIRKLTQQDQSDWSPIGGSLVPLTRTTTTYSSTYPFVPTSVELKQWNGSSYVTQGKTVLSYDEYSLDPTSGVPHKSTPAYARRNVTTVSRYKDATNHVDEHFYYDDVGNVIQHVDARGKNTDFSFADNFSESGDNGNTRAYPTLVTNAEGHAVETVYDFHTGLPVSVVDARGLETVFTYDEMNRPLTVTESSGRVTTTSYADSAPQKVTEEVTVVSGTPPKVAKTETTFDRLGRITQAKSFDPDGDVLVDTQYDGNGRVESVSAPYRSGSPGWTQTAYDVLGRPVMITNPDSTTVEFAYEDNTVTGTDANGVERRETRNALGQLTKVEEPNPDLSSALETTYSYYVFGPLSQVTQGAQTRTYTRDWLGRLLEEAHPEWINSSTQYTATYVYDAGGLLTSRTDPRSKVAEYTYDDIGRPLTLTYSDSTPDVAYTYDQNDFAGFLTTVDVDGVTASAFEYDDAGQLIEETVTFDGVSGSFTTSYEYDLGGRLVEITYPSGRVVTRTYDAGGGIASGRLASLTNGPTSTALVGSIQDNAAGQITSRTLGSSIQETRSFNNRFQLTGIGTTVSSTTLLGLTYDYGTTTNTGRILSRTDGVQPEHSVSYTYDEIGRLTEVEAASPAWSVSWELDRWGNRTSQTPTGLASGRVGSQSIYYGNDNKNDAWTYDNAGNVTSDTSHNYTWDAENRMIQMDSSSNVYAYDGEGRRIKRTAGSVTTYYLYGLTGLLSEFSDSTTLSSATAAASTDRLEYRVGDATGTAVLLMDGSGNVRANNRVFPFGEAWWYPLGSGTKENFTTYQRDSALDYAMARYYRFTSGRFMSTDPGHAGASVGDPQTWNAYAYVDNDPINSTDPTGLFTSTIQPLTLPPAPTGHSGSSTLAPGGCISMVINGLPMGLICRPLADIVNVVGQTVQKVVEHASQSPAACMGTAGALGVLGGVAAFGLGGAAAGGAGGGLLGSVEPGGGTVLGAAAGAGLGAGGGMMMGAQVGATTGIVAGAILCRNMSGSGNGGGNTTHGNEQLAKRGFTPEDIAFTKTGRVMTQSDGAKVFLKEMRNGRFNVIVEGSRGVITALKNIDAKAVANLTRNYGWH